MEHGRDLRSTRRELLAACGGVSAALAGCAAAERGNRDQPVVYTSIFPLYEFARSVGGEAIEVRNAVPSGEHGHAWEPPADLLADVVSADAFVYLDIEGFQPWALDVAAEIETDYEDVRLIDGLSGVELLRYEGHDHDHSHDHDDDHSHDHDDDHSHDHSHGEYDAKFFADPKAVTDGVEAVRDGLIGLDPDAASLFHDNAAAYIDELETLHERFAVALEERGHDVAVLAGHDSFRYLADRHGFEIHTPVGLSPHAEPASEDIAETIDLLEERNIDTVLWDYFDGDRLAGSIAREAATDPETIAVSAAENTAPEWQEAGHGDYIGQLSEITLPAFEAALDAD
ncbi:MAG: zinc ABC transporter substrate-binding protein [Natronomonas sp.]